MACTINGRDIRENASENGCPKDYFTNPPRKGLGDTLATLFRRIGVERLVKWMFPKCRCGQRRGWLNKLLPYKRGGSTSKPRPAGVAVNTR